MTAKECPELEKKLDSFRQTCKAHGIKLTPQRLLIYQELISTDDHPSTDMLYQRVRTTFPTISFDTVNRTLLTFHEIGLAHLIEGTGNPKRFDGNMGRHHHCQCIHCKKIVDIFCDEYNTISIPSGIQQEFEIVNATVRLEGICAECRQKIERKESYM